MKEKVQVFGRFLSSMVMPNIGAFIAWGLIAALFIDTGWIPNAYLSKLVDPMSHYMLPLLIAYTGGKLVGGVRGGVTGAIATMGVIVATEVPMFLGAMIMGPFSGWIIKNFDKAIKGKVKAGFEMLVDNFSVGIICGENQHSSSTAAMMSLSVMFSGAAASSCVSTTKPSTLRLPNGTKTRQPASICRSSSGTRYV